MKRYLLALLLLLPTFAQAQRSALVNSKSSTWSLILPPAPVHNFFFTPQTWFVRTDGGTRYSANVLTGQCDGLADTAYPGSGVNQHCSFNDFRYLYDDGSYGNYAWVIAGGDTIVVRGCHALASQQNPSDPNCRIGYDTDSGPGAGGWCAGSLPNTQCGIPDLPSGTSGAHTKLLGGCAYGTYTCTPVVGYPYASNNLAQLFGGFGVGYVLSLANSTYVDVEGIEITAHNGACTYYGSPQWPKACSSASPADDFSNNGIVTTPTTNHITMQDVYAHGFAASGMYGPTGANTVLTRVSLDFNAFAGWNMDSGGESNGPGATLTQSYVTMVGNGCNEQYPISNTSFPAKSCYDTNTAGFGDSWSGQTCNTSDPDCSFTAFSCDHCFIAYNVKDGAMGPHVAITTLTLTNSAWVGNHGATGKWGIKGAGTFRFQNNIFIANCGRWAATIAGAAQNFSSTTGLNGSYVTECRGNDMFAYTSDGSSDSLFANNTFIFSRNDAGTQEVGFDLACYTSSGCAAAPKFTDNVFLGYPSPDTTKPALFFDTDVSITPVVSHNVEFNMRAGESCGVNGVICSDPLLLNEPSSSTPSSNLDVLIPGGSSGANLTGTSPSISAGTAYTGSPSSDYYGVTQTSPLTIGAVVFVGVPPPPSAFKFSGPGIKLSGPGIVVSH